MSQAQQNAVAHENIVLTKALKNAASYWDITNRQLGEIIGLSEPTISRLKNGQYILDPKTKHWQLAVLFLRIFRALGSYMGGNTENERLWLKSNNLALGGTPLELMCRIETMPSVVEYLDYMRGQ